MNRRARICLDVTNLPSLPAKGLSFTAKVISLVGSLTFTNSSGSGLATAVMVSPIVMSSAPEKQTISPILASSTGTLTSPSIWYIETIRVRLGAEFE